MVQVLIPMAGNGSRFVQAGYPVPKPLIDVEGKPMIKRVIENLGDEHTFTFIVRKEHIEGPWGHKLFETLSSLADGFSIKILDKITEGAACTCLEARQFLSPSYPLLIANCDQLLDWDPNDFFEKSLDSHSDGTIVTFDSNNPAHSYVKLDKEGYITEVAEKKVISNKATAGLYFWNHAQDFFDCAEAMIERNLRVNGEFYVSPVHNIGIQTRMLFNTYHVDHFWPLGTPEQLDALRQLYKAYGEACRGDKPE